MFLPGNKCGCCCGCPKCNPSCLLLTASFQEGSGGGGDDGLCSERKSFTEKPIILRRGDACDIKITPSVVGNPSGSGAKVSVELSKSSSSSGDYKYISKITLLESGSGYTNGATFAYSLTCSSSQCNVAPTISLGTGRVQPTLKASVAGGSGATLTPVMRPLSTETDAETWEVDSVTVDTGGTKYTDGASVTFSLNKATSAIPAEATISVARSAPDDLYASLQTESGYAIAKVSFATETLPNGSVWWATQENATVFQQYGTFSLGQTFTASAPESVFWGTPGTLGGLSVAVTGVNENGVITAVTATKRYAYKTDGSIASVNVIQRGEYYTQDGVKSATIIDGGKFFYDNPCTYTAGMGNNLLCAACPDHTGTRLFKAALTLGSSEATLNVTVGSNTLMSATASLDGTNCEGLSFSDNGLTATVSPTDCANFDDPDDEHRRKQFCEQMPDSVTMSLSGMARLFVWSARGGGYPGLGYCDDPEQQGGQDPGIFCGQCEEPAAYLRQVGMLLGIPAYTGSLIIQDCDVVCDLVSSDCGGWIYEGFAPSSPSSAGAMGYQRNFSCGGDLLVPVIVQISPTDVFTSVSIAPPRFAGETATADVDVAGGAVSEINVTNGGSGYAREIILRVQPTVTAAAQSTNGSNASFLVALQSNNDDPESWYVSSVTVSDGGSGYTGTEPLSFSVAQGDTIEFQAWGQIVVGRVQPTLSASAAGGSGAVLSVTLSQTTDWNTGAAAWEVASVSVVDGGSGYTDGGAVTFTVDDGVEIPWSAAAATVTTTREEPTVSASVQTWSSASGAALSVTIQSGGQNNWVVASVSVTSGGSGYSQYDSVAFTTPDTEGSPAYGYVSSVDENGAVTGVAITWGGSYWRSTGVIQSVEMSAGGLYYKSTGSIVSVAMQDVGSYVRLQHTGQAEVDTPVVSISSRTGRGAKAEADVDATVQSPTFGQVVSVRVTAGGEKYFLAGSGWIINVSVGVGNLSHRQILLEEPVPPENPNPWGPLHCDNRTDKWDLIYERVSTKTCPTDLIGKSYTMAMGIGDPSGSRFSWPEGFADYCVNPGNNYHTADGLLIFGFGGDITCSIQ